MPILKNLGQARFNPTPGGDYMGVGPTGIGNPNVVFKRKFRWTFEVESTTQNEACKFAVPAYFCKISARPNLSFEDTELNWLNDKMWIPGKASWETITVTYVDVAGSLTGKDAGGNLGLYQWLLNVYNFAIPHEQQTSDRVQKAMNSKRAAYGGRVYLTLWDGCGQALESWILHDAWPQAINFGDLDYSSSDTVDIELTLRYSMVSFTHRCPEEAFSGCCDPCA